MSLGSLHFAPHLASEWLVQVHTREVMVNMQVKVLEAITHIRPDKHRRVQLVRDLLGVPARVSYSPPERILDLL